MSKLCLDTSHLKCKVGITHHFIYFKNSGMDSPQISWRYVSRFLIT
jgi:hypothetical protein